MRIYLIALCIVLLYSLSPVQAGFNPVHSIDDFEVETQPLSVLNPNTGRSATTRSSTAVDSVPGGLRELVLTTESGPAGSVLSTEVQSGQWSSASPRQAAGFSSLQYDGTEGSTDYTGLQCFDLTIGGRARGFGIRAMASSATDFKFFVYGMTGGAASLGEQVNGDEENDYYIPFSSFHGASDVDFTCVGAIVVTATIPAYSDFSVDAFYLGTYTEDPSVTPSRTPSGTPSPSRTPSRSPLISQYMEGPTQSPTPSRVAVVNHQCESDDQCVQTSPCIDVYCDTKTYKCVSRTKQEEGCCSSSYDCTTNQCQQADCQQSQCVFTAKPTSGCCSKASDCNPGSCQEASCVDNQCSYVAIACIDSNSIKSSDTSDGGNGM